MPISTDTNAALSLLERLQRSVKESDDLKMTQQFSHDLNTLISVLESPVFKGLLNIQDSLKELKRQIVKHPSIVSSDFDISRDGKLLIHVSPNGVEDSQNNNQEGRTILAGQFNSNLDQVTDVVQSSATEAVNTALRYNENGTNATDNAWDGGEKEQINDQLNNNQDDDRTTLDNQNNIKIQQEQFANNVKNKTLTEENKVIIENAAIGRELHHIQLYKPDGSSLGFSVVGLRSEQRGELGIYVQGIQPTGIAAQDGRLQEGDQILAIDGQVLDCKISHQHAISFLQQATHLVELYVARAPPVVHEEEEEEPYQGEEKLQDPISAVPEIKTTMLNTDWAQVEVINLVNDGMGLGFGIIGGRSTGVVVKTILPGGVADRDGRLLSGDHILQIGEVNLRGMGSDQVASVLRQSGSHVRLIVARPVEPTSPDFKIGRTPPIVETRVLNDPEELDRHLNMIHNGYAPPSTSSNSSSASTAVVPTNGHVETSYTGELLMTSSTDASSSGAVGAGTDSVIAATPTSILSSEDKLVGPDDEELETEDAAGSTLTIADLPEMEIIELQLGKDHQGLGITIAGYVCEREELSGIFVKSVNAGSAADRCGQIRVNDQIVEVDGHSLSGLSNHAAVDVLRATGQMVKLRLARYLRGPKYEQLQQAIANSELKTTPTTPNPPRAPLGDLPSGDALRSALERVGDRDEAPGGYSAGGSQSSILSSTGGMHLSTAYASECEVQTKNITNISTTNVPVPSAPSNPMGIQSDPVSVSTSELDALTSNHPEDDVRLSKDSINFSSTNNTSPEMRLEDIELMIDSNYSGVLQPSVENAIQKKWSRIIGQEFDIVIAQVSKFEEGGGLGISLEGTVDVEDGREVRPHHYIRSILPYGPVGKNSILKSGDELLEVNGQKLLGLNHIEVVSILKELPQSVRIVCGRRAPGAPQALHPIDAPTADRDTFAARNILGGSLQNLLPSSERLVKAKSDGSLASSANAATNDSSFSRIKSRSLEPLTGLAMWSSEPQVIELTKGDRGLGFSILDYQDPLNPQETVIVIRSLVPGGVAEKDGRLIPGDRLVAVNGACLENATLDQAVAALKGAPKGPVNIAVAKPISVLESPSQLDAFLGDLGSSEGGSDVTDDPYSHQIGDDTGREGVMLDHTKPDDDEHQPPLKISHRATGSIISIGSDIALPSDAQDSGDPNSKASVLMVPVATERLLGGPNLGTSSTIISGGSNPTLGGISSGDEEGSPHGSPAVSRWVAQLPPLPKTLERTIRVKKGSDQLGVNIEVVDHGVNGVVISSLVRNGAVHKDGRLHAGDLILSVNNESFRNITNSQARAILRRAQLISTDVNITYIPGQAAATHREAALLQYRASNNIGYQEEVVVSTGDLTRSITAPSFVTRQLQSQSQDDILGHSLPNQQTDDSAAQTVINIKHALSETFNAGQETPSKLGTSVHIGNYSSQEENSDEGPFTITFRNVSEAQVSSRSLSLEPGQLLEDKEVESVLIKGQGSNSASNVVSGRPPGGSSSTVRLKRETADKTNQTNSEDFLDSGGGGVFLSDSNQRFVRFSEHKVRSELSESSDSSADRGSSLYVECDSDVHSVSDVLSDDLNNSCAKLVIAHITDVESLVSKRSITSSISFEEPKSIPPYLEKQYSEVIPPSSYYTRDELYNSQLKRNLVKSESYSAQPISSYSSNLNDEDLIDVSDHYGGNLYITDRLPSNVHLLPNKSSKTRSSPASSKSTMTVTQGLTSPSRSGAASPSPSESIMDGKHWGPERTVEVKRDEKKSLGISIVGGKVDLTWTGSSVTGIFIKNVLPESPAGRSGLLKTGDRILEVEGTDLRNATHEKAVQVIKNTGDPVIFIVQSLIQWTPANSRPASRNASQLGGRIPDAVTPARSPTPEVIQEGLSDNKRQELQAGRSMSEDFSDDDLDDEDEDNRYDQGVTVSKKGATIDRASAGAVRRSRAEKEADKEEEDDFGYTAKKIQKKYCNLKGRVVVAELQKPDTGLGISIAGNKDRTQMSVFICGLNPNGPAYKDGKLQVGDEVLEVNGLVLYGRSHLNASAIFKGIPGSLVKIIVLRSPAGKTTMAVKPVTRFPIVLEEQSPEDKYAKYKGLTKIVMKKSGGGLGIMIIEGKHQDYGLGIFISDLQEGSPAVEANLMVGDMILCVNKENMAGVDYASATEILKKLDGVINMWVCNPVRAGEKPPKNAPGVPRKPADPLTDPIEPGQTTIEIIKEKMGLGLSIVGGSDTLLQGAIIIHEVYPDGAAAKDGRLKPGDQILEVNSENFRDITHQRALSVLRQTPSKDKEKVKMLVSREEGTKEEDLMDIMTVNLTKKSGKGLGLSIVGRKNGPGVFISDLVPQGVAESNGTLMQGDQILEVNDKDLRKSSQEQAAAILKCAPSAVVMKIGRLKPGKNTAPASNWPITINDGSAQNSTPLNPERPPTTQHLISQSLPPPHVAAMKQQQIQALGIRTVLLDRAEDGLGFSIVGGFGSNLGDLPIYVKSVFERGAAAREGSLRRGDQILQVNGQSLAGLTHAEAVTILKEARGAVALTILPSK